MTVNFGEYSAFLAFFFCVFTLANFATAGGNNQHLDASLRPLDVKWDARSLPIRWGLSTDGLQGSGIANQQLQIELNLAFITWQSVPSATVEFENAGEYNRRKAELDGFNLVTFSDPDVEFPPGVLALSLNTVLQEELIIDESNNDINGDGIPDLSNGSYAPGTVIDGDIVFNSGVEWSISGDNGSNDIRAIAIHEIGHMLGLSHSAIEDALMWPFANSIVAAGRTLAVDDIAYVSSFYPAGSDYALNFGQVTGRVINGLSNYAVLGAHVYAQEVESGKKLVGGYSGLDGYFSLPVPPGRYFIGIEPMDGDPAAMDPKRINSVIRNTLDTNFIEEYFDANESNLEADPLAALPIVVTSGRESGGVDFFTNTVNLPGVSRVLTPGINYFAYPVAVPEALTAFDLLTTLGSADEINAIDRFNKKSKLYERAAYVNGRPAGINFSIVRGEGYLIHSKIQKTINFFGTPDCPSLSLVRGMNLIGVPCSPASFDSFDLLQALGSQTEVISVYRRANDTVDEFEKVEYVAGEPSGDAFYIVNGEAYLVDMNLNKPVIDVPGDHRIYPPSISGISPGRGVPGDLVVITGEGFDDQVENNQVSFDGVGAAILFATKTTLAVSIPQNANSGTVQVTVNGQPSNRVGFEVESVDISESQAKGDGVLSGQKVTGELTGAGEQDRYEFLAAKGANISVTARALGGADLFLALEGEAGVLLASDDDSADGANPEIKNFKVPYSGRFTVVVASVSGIGRYELILKIQSTATEPEISILDGASQSTAVGTDLPRPLEIFVSSATGKPLAGAAITITASNLDISTNTSGFAFENAGTTVITTNSNGIAIVRATAPSQAGVYEISVSVPGLPPATLQVSATSTAISYAVVSSQVEDCGGSGCEVGQTLPLPYHITYYDAQDQPVENVLTGWKVVAGGGSIDTSVTVSDSSGRTEVWHTLGKKLYATLGGEQTKVPLSQAVVASAGGQQSPILFSAQSKAGPPAKIEGLRSNYIRLTHGKASPTAIKLRVTDQYDNPVQGVPLEADNSGVDVFLGVLEGEQLTEMATNEDGIWVGGINAFDSTPTIDEFGTSSSVGLASQYAVSISAGAAGTLEYWVDVDMGPTMATSNGFLASGLITYPLDEDLQIEVSRYQRRDQFTDVNGDNEDDDQGIWLDEGFTNLREIGIENIGIELSARRGDGKDEREFGLTQTLFDGAETQVLLTDSEGRINTNLTLSDVAGEIQIFSEIQSPIVPVFETDEGETMAGAVLDVPFTEYQRIYTPVNALAVELEIVIDADQGSGLDWVTLLLLLNGKSIFDGSSDSYPALNKFPSFLRLFIDGTELLEWPDAEALAAGGFSELRLIYQPNGQELLRGQNNFEATANVDAVGGASTFAFSETFNFNGAVENAYWAVEQVLDSQWEYEFNLTSTTSLAMMQGTTVPATGTGASVFGDYEVFTVEVTEPSAVTVELLDADKVPITTLIDESSLPAQTYRFVLLQEDVENHITRVLDKPDMHILVTSTAIANGQQSTTLYRGELKSQTAGRMLGQVKVHDTLLQDGSLSLSREDLALKGAGPQLNFVRSYNNIRTPENENSALGAGWSHNHEIYASILAWSDGSPPFRNNLPGWVAGAREALQPILLSNSEFSALLPDPANKAPAVIAISNGGVFQRNANGQWLGQRGNHGELTGDTATGYVFTSKDGTRYAFAPQADPDGRFPVQTVTDRNGNALSYIYETTEISATLGEATFAANPVKYVLTRVEDGSGRYLQFNYALTDTGAARLASVDAVMAGSGTAEDIHLAFDYYRFNSQSPEEVAVDGDSAGMLRRSSRSNFTETYEYTAEGDDGFPNLAALIDANGRRTEYKYHEAIDTQFLALAPGTALTDLVRKVCYPTNNPENLCEEDFALIEYSTIDSVFQRVVTDLRGYSTTYTLNRWGNPVRVEEPEGKTTEYEWSIDLGEADNLMRFKRELATGVAEWEYQYDTKGNLTLEEDPFGNSTEQRWHPQYAVLEYRKDKNGNEVTYGLDAFGNVETETTDATVAGVPTTVTTVHHYKSFGSLQNLREWTENGRGYRTTYDYDDRGNLKSITLPADADTGQAIITRFINNRRGYTEWVFDPSDNATEYRYDDLDRIEWEIDAAGNSVHTVYDAKGNKDWVETTETYYTGQSQSDEHTVIVKLDYSYDARDRVVGITRTGTLDGATEDSRGNSYYTGQQSFDYDGNGNLTMESDWFNRKTYHVYDDGLNRRTRTTNRDGKVKQYDYDYLANLQPNLKKGWVKHTTDFNNHTTHEYFDQLGRLYRIEHPEVTAHLPDGNEEALSYHRTLEYDHLENVTATIDEDGNRTEVLYDGRYLKTQRTDALAQTFIWQYDANGNITKTRDEADRETIFEYDAQDRVSSKTGPENHVTEYTDYQANGNLLREVDPWGFATSYTYNALNQVATLTHTDGTEVLRHTKSGELTYKLDAENRAVSNLYGPGDRLRLATDARGRKTRYGYDNNGNLTDTLLTWDNPYTGQPIVHTHTDFDVLDRKWKLHEGYGNPKVRVTTYGYDDQGNLTSVHVPDTNNSEGQVRSFVYDELNRVKTRIAPQTHNYAGSSASDNLATETLTRYNGTGKVVWLADRRGNKTVTTYDALNRVDTITDALDHVIDYEYDPVGNVRFVKDKNDNVRETVYDGLNRITEQYIATLSDPEASTLEAASQRAFLLQATRYEVDGLKLGERTDEIEDAEGNVVTNTYDWRGNLVVETQPAGEWFDSNFDATETIHVYDNSGWLRSTTVAGQYRKEWTYYADGTIATATQVQSVASIEDETTVFQYDIFGNRALEVLPKQNTRAYLYDVRNRLSQVEDHLGNVTRFEYDANNNLLNQYTPAANDDGDENRVQYVYDERNLKRAHIQHKSGGNLTVLYGYDAEGNLATLTDAKNQVFTNEYDALNRISEQLFPTGSDIERIVTTYDNNSNLDVVTEYKPGNTIEITDHNYDLLDRLTSRAQRGHTVSYSYDNNGNRLTVTSPGGVTSYTYDTRNRLSMVTANDLTSYTYYPTGWTDTVNHGNNSSVKYEYDDAGRALHITNLDANAQILSQFDYQYDLNGNRVEEVQTQNGFTDAARQVMTTTYLYDDLDRLENYTQLVDGVEETHSFTYYPSYDRKTEVVTRAGATLKDRTYQYDQTHWLNAITEAAGAGGTISYGYDNNGNTLSKLNTVSAPASTQMEYNSRNQLVSVASGALGSELNQGAYHYNFNGMRIRHLGSSRGDIEYIYDQQSIVDEVVNNTATQVAHYRYGDRLLSLQSAGDDQFYHYANLGTTANLTDSSGFNQVAYRLDPFGEITEQEGVSVNRQVFTGHEHDTETGLIYMKARFYDPDIGRFLSQDTYLGESSTPPSLHRYLYAYSNPTVWVDLFGFDNSEFFAALATPAEDENIRRYSFNQTSGETFQPTERHLDGYDNSKNSWIAHCQANNAGSCDAYGFDGHLKANAAQKELQPVLTDEISQLESNRAYAQGEMGDEYFYYLEGHVRRTDHLEVPLLAASIFMPGRGSGINNLSKSVKALRKGAEAVEEASEALDRARQAKRVVRSGGEVVPNSTSSVLRSEAASNIREARSILRETRPDLTVTERNNIIKSFELETFRVKTLDAELTEFRYFDGLDDGAGLNGRWSTSNWIDNPGDRISILALPNNQATRAATVKLQPGTTVFQGTVAPQLKFGPNLTGGGSQSFNVLGPRAIIEEIK